LYPVICYHQRPPRGPLAVQRFHLAHLLIGSTSPNLSPKAARTQFPNYLARGEKPRFLPASEHPLRGIFTDSVRKIPCSGVTHAIPVTQKSQAISPLTGNKNRRPQARNGNYLPVARPPTSKKPTPCTRSEDRDAGAKHPCVAAHPCAARGTARLYAIYMPDTTMSVFAQVLRATVDSRCNYRIDKKGVYAQRSHENRPRRARATDRAPAPLPV
jgi:hypothetical protein